MWDRTEPHCFATALVVYNTWLDHTVLITFLRMKLTLNIIFNIFTERMVLWLNLFCQCSSFQTTWILFNPVVELNELKVLQDPLWLMMYIIILKFRFCKKYINSNYFDFLMNFIQANEINSCNIHWFILFYFNETITRIIWKKPVL